MMAYAYGDLRRAADAILSASPLRPRTAVVLGSGLGGLAEMVEQAHRIPYAQIPGFPAATAPSHAGELILGSVAGCETAVLAGRFHYYEGLSPAETAFYVGALKAAGVERLILTNAAGCINPSFKIGSLMLVRDHINLSGISPLRGANPDALGPRFFDMSRAYSPELRGLALECAREAGITVQEGVYAFMPGPQYETPAEVRALKLLGADAVGMSTVPEVIAAAHCGMEVLCISCLTNYAAGVAPGRLSHGEVMLNAQKSAQTLSEYLERIIKRAGGCINA